MANLLEIFELTKYGDVKFEEFKKALPLDQIDLVNTHGRTPLMSSCYFLENLPNIKTVQYLVDNGADIDAKEADGITSLMFLCQFWTNSPSIESIKTIKFLIENGANMNEENVWGENALTYLYYHSNNPTHVKTLKYLIKAGINIDTFDVHKYGRMTVNIMRMLDNYCVINSNRWSVGRDLFGVI